MDRALIILIALAFVLGLYAIRSRRRVKKETEEALFRRRRELIQQALDRWFELDIIEALDTLYQERVELFFMLIRSRSACIEKDGEFHTIESIERDKKILMAEMIRLRKERTDKQRAQIERESGFEVIHSARV